MIKITQIAIRIPSSIKNLKSNISDILGHTDWMDDHLKMKGHFGNYGAKDIELDLSFNFKIIESCELEFIRTTSEFHWHEEIIGAIGDVIFLSHLGSYCDKKTMLDFDKIMINNGVRKLQDSFSYDHSNKRSSGIERQYHDIIYDTEEIFGFRLKLTSKIGE